MMMQTKKPIIQILALLLLGMSSLLLISCADSRPSTEAAAIEDTENGLEILEQEFSECEGEEIPDNPMEYTFSRGYGQTSSERYSYSQQSLLERDFPHIYSSFDKTFPLRGSWRKTKAEILDIVDRRIWSPEQGRSVALLEYFDMVLMINVSARNTQTPTNSSAQRMQVLVRNSPSSHNLNSWNRLHVWPISSGLPCGKKIETPTGVFKFNPGRAYENYYSKLFDNVQMFQTMFLYHSYQNGKSTGVAIHGTEIIEKLGRRDSGGCVRVKKDNMSCLFDTITGKPANNCLGGGLSDYYGRVPSFLPKNGEADPDYLNSGYLEVNGYRVLIAIYDDNQDTI